MKSQFLDDHVTGIPINSSAAHKPIRMSPVVCLTEGDSQYHRSSSSACRPIRLGPKITKTVKGKLSLGAKILQVGGIDRIFRKLFSVSEDEKLLKACQCYLSTTAGPIAGLLSISTHKVAFCSERSIKISNPNGKPLRLHYKVSIPLSKINSVEQSENVKEQSQKIMEIMTLDNFDFWFMGFLSYEKAFKYIQQAISQAHDV